MRKVVYTGWSLTYLSFLFTYRWLIWYATTHVKHLPRVRSQSSLFSTSKSSADGLSVSLTNTWFGHPFFTQCWHLSTRLWPFSFLIFVLVYFSNFFPAGYYYSKSTKISITLLSFRSNRRLKISWIRFFYYYMAERCRLPNRSRTVPHQLFLFLFSFVLYGCLLKVYCFFFLRLWLSVNSGQHSVVFLSCMKKKQFVAEGRWNIS